MLGDSTRGFVGVLAFAYDHGARRHGARVAVGGLAAQLGCSSVIAGATSPEQFKANAQAASWVPSADELLDLDRLVPAPSGSG